jgi:hypothetical protein
MPRRRNLIQIFCWQEKKCLYSRRSRLLAFCSTKHHRII